MMVFDLARKKVSNTVARPPRTPIPRAEPLRALATGLAFVTDPNLPRPLASRPARLGSCS
jgi:hypothetical protein